MLTSLKRGWQHFAARPPGERFISEYREHNRSGRSTLSRFLSIGAGVLILVAGLFFLPAPGPGFVIVGIGAALLARESKALARFLDRAELWLRRCLRWMKRQWRAASLPIRGLVVLVVLLIAALAAWVGYRVLFLHR